jgi:hypothetical protein
VNTIAEKKDEVNPEQRQPTYNSELITLDNPWDIANDDVKDRDAKEDDTEDAEEKPRRFWRFWNRRSPHAGIVR